jgi:ketosteroid isomerase-like protein
MTLKTFSRRNLLVAGTCALAGASSLVSTSRLFAGQNGSSGEEKGASGNKEEIIRTYYSGYEKKDWNLTGGVLADNFTFTSPNDDDHISKDVFKKRCFLSQLDFIKRFDLQVILTGGDDAFVKYVGHTTKGTSFTNTEYFRFAGGKVAAIECYFGAKMSFAAASGV